MLPAIESAIAFSAALVIGVREFDEPSPECGQKPRVTHER